jgi:hypothetical protein
VFRFDVSRSVMTVQCEFRSRFKKDAPHKNNVFINRARNSRCSVITDLATSNEAYIKPSVTTPSSKLVPRPRRSMRNELMVVREKLGQFPLLTVYVVLV